MTTASSSDRWASLGEFIRQQRNTARLSLRRLSEIAGISNPICARSSAGLRNHRPRSCSRVRRALRISAETHYVRAGILEDERRDDDVVQHRLMDPFLVEEQRQALVRIYLSFRRENGQVDTARGRHGLDVETSSLG